MTFKDANEFCFTLQISNDKDDKKDKKAVDSEEKYMVHSSQIYDKWVDAINRNINYAKFWDKVKSKFNTIKNQIDEYLNEIKYDKLYLDSLTGEIKLYDINGKLKKIEIEKEDDYEDEEEENYKLNYINNNENLNRNGNNGNKINNQQNNKNINQLNKINLNKNISSESILKSTINNSTINNINKNNNLNQTITGDTFHTNDKSETIKNFNHTNSASNILIPKINISRNNKITYTSVKKYFSNSSKKGKYIKSLQLNNILNKCNEDLKFARNLGENVEKNNQDKFVGRMNKRFKTVLKTRDQKIMEDKGKVDKKYHKKEKEKFKELKKNIDMKLSDKYAYINRKQMNEFIREHENILAYQIYLRDMNKFNKIQKKTKEIEKKNMTLVENLLEDSFRQKEFLKYKVDNFYIKHAKQDELNKFSIQNRNRDDYFLNKNGQNNKHLKGTLLPKLIEIKDYCYGRPKHNPIAEMEDNIND
jgi:hypothetical protein